MSSITTLMSISLCGRLALITSRNRNKQPDNSQGPCTAVFPHYCHRRWSLSVGLNFVGPFIREREFASTHTAGRPSTSPDLHVQIPSNTNGNVFSIGVGNPWMSRADCRYGSTLFPSGDVSTPGFWCLRGLNPPWILRTG